LGNKDGAQDIREIPRDGGMPEKAREVVSTGPLSGVGFPIPARQVFDAVSVFRARVITNNRKRTRSMERWGST
jgi:hypothetical protein